MEEQLNKNNNSIWWVVGIIIVLVAGIGIYQFYGQTPNNSQATVSGEITNTTGATSTAGSATTSGVKSFTLETKNFSFSVKQIKVKQGDMVKIIINNQEGTHDFVLDEFKVRTSRVTGSGTVETQFVADKTGSFEYYCSVGNHRQMGMKGTLIVE